MKFNVGDRVKNIGRESYYGICLGDIGIVTEESPSPFVKWDKNKKLVAFNEEELELVYTYEDLKKSPIGTKITFENRKLFVKNGEDKFESPNDFIYIDDFKSLTNCEFGKIIKIEEPEYKTVYEAKPEILDEAEKRYLKGVIRPFRDKVTCIKKFVYSTGEAKIDINVENWYICLPLFPKNKMYKNMEEDKKYTLEELGL